MELTLGIGVNKKQCPKITLEGDRRRAAAIYQMSKRKLSNLINYVEDAGFSTMTRKIPNFTGKGDDLEYGVRGNQTYIKVYSPVPDLHKAIITEPPRLTDMCFCSCFFAQAKVLEVIEDYNNNGPSDMEQIPYPYYCSIPKFSIIAYLGIRYKVAVCQKYPSYLVPGGLQSDMAPFVAPSIGFTPYVVGDRVVVIYRGRWKGKDLQLPACASCFEACMAERRFYQGFETRADGSFVLAPFQSYPITGYLENAEIPET
jgi:hypothetical protein